MERGHGDALRPPVLAAKTAAQLDQASNGRFILGLGVANSVMTSGSGSRRSRHWR
jgi:5,10-methylenetetrahydromethanopterin reductase